MRLKVLISLGKHFYEAFPYLGQWLRQEGLEVIEQVDSDQEPPRALLEQLIANADIYVVGVDRVDQELMNAAPNLKLIVKHGAGYDNIDLDCAKRRHIPVTFAPGCNAQSVAEFAVAMMLSLCRGIAQCGAEVRAGQWQLFMGYELSGKNLGLIGYGNIGRRVASIAKAFGMRVLVVDPFLSEEQVEADGVHLVTLDEALEQADVLSLHAPSTKENFHLINEHTLRQMKASAYIINTARGSLVDEQALVQALREGRLQGSAMYVVQHEPPTQEITALPHTICTPHIGGCTYARAAALARMSFENIMHFINQQPLVNRLV